MTCNCSNSVKIAGALFCYQCGSEFAEPTTTRCRTCNTTLFKGSNFCYQCGVRRGAVEIGKIQADLVGQIKALDHDRRIEGDYKKLSEKIGLPFAQNDVGHIFVDQSSDTKWTFINKTNPGGVRIEANEKGTLVGVRDAHRSYRVSNRATLVDTIDADVRRELLINVYKEVSTSWRMLTDVRFKLLALIPAASLIVWAVLYDPTKVLQPLMVLAASVIGYTIVLALYVYDRRNSELYDDLISRGRRIEFELGLVNGQFLGRPTPTVRIPVIPFNPFTSFYTPIVRIPIIPFIPFFTSSARKVLAVRWPERCHLRVRHEFSVTWVYYSVLTGWLLSIIYAIGLVSGVVAQPTRATAPTATPAPVASMTPTVMPTPTNITTPVPVLAPGAIATLPSEERLPN